MKTKRRRIGIAAAVGAGVVLLLVALGWLVWMPSVVRGRVQDAAARRGLRASVGSVEVGLSTVVLGELGFSDPGEAVQVTVGELALDAGLWELALEGRSAAETIRATDVAVTVRLDAPELEALIERVRGRRSDAGDTGGGSERSLIVENLTGELRDREGVLGRVEEGLLTLADGTIHFSGGPAELAPGEDDGVRVGEFEVRGTRGADGLELESVSLVDVAVRYRERGGSAPSRLWARLARQAAAWGGARAPSAGGPADADGSRGFELGPAITRARALLGPHLAEGALLRLEGLAVTAKSEHGRRTVLRELDAEVQALGEGRFRLSGAGRPGRGGRVGWRLVVNPGALRAEGRLDFQRLPFVLITPLLPELPWYRPEDTRLSGELSIEGRGATQIHLEGQVSVADLGLSSPRVAPEPVEGVSVALAGEATWDPTTRRLDVSRGTLSLGDARVVLTGSLEWPEDHYLIDMRATLPPTDCDSAVAAIPVDLLAELGGFTFSGQLGGRVIAHVDSRDLGATSLEIDVADGCNFVTAPVMADVRRFAGPFTHRVVEPSGEIFEMETGPGTVNWVPIGDMSTFFVQAVLGHEDGGFFSHHGFSTGAIETALIRNLRAGRFVYGASTITMQLVKNVFLRREKTLARKVQEVLLTWWVESVMTKEQILELYLNVIEYGPGVYGIRNAAAHYFGVTPAELGPAQSAYLASILPDPKGYHAHWEEDAVSERFTRRVERFLQTLGARERYDAEAVAYGIERLHTLDFHHPGEPPPPPAIHRGAAAPLPFGRPLQLQWEEALGPDGY